MDCIGIDMVEIVRIQKAGARWGKRFLRRIYTEPELELCQGKSPSLASRFAAKEAVMKLLGTGHKGVSWQEIEIIADRAGKPVVNLYGAAQNQANNLNLGQLAISLTHSREYALACVSGNSKNAQPYQ